jgi:hypothetical protein
MKTFYVANIDFNLSDTVSIKHEIGASASKTTKSEFEKNVQDFIEQSKLISPWNFTSVDYVIEKKTYKKAPKNFVK